MDEQQIEGLPPGAVVKPIAGGPATQPITGLPPGAVVKPIGGGSPPASSSTSATPPAATDHSDPNNRSFADNYVSVNLPFAEGVGKNLAELGRTAMNVVHHVPGAGRALDNSELWQHARKTVNDAANTPMESGAQKAGYTATEFSNWGLGEEAIAGILNGLQGVVKGKSYLDRLKAVQPVADFALKHPIAGRIIYSALKNAGMGGLMEAAHGGSAGDVAKGAAVAGGAGAAAQAAAEGVGAVVRSVKPSTTQIAGETMPVLASQKPGATPLSRSVADIGSEPAVAQAQQQGANRAIHNMAQQATRDALEELNAARQTRWDAGERDINLGEAAEPARAPASRQIESGQSRLGNGASGAPQIEGGSRTGMSRTNELGAHEGEFPESQGDTQRASSTGAASAEAGTTAPPRSRVSYIEERPANFQPIDVDAESSGVDSYRAAAEKIREHARPIYQRLDQASGGKFAELRQTLADAYNDGDYKTVRETEDAIDSLLESTRNKVDKVDYQAAKKAWRTSKVLDAAHSAVSRAFNITDEGLANEAGVWRGISGGKLQTGLNRIVERYGRSTLDQVLGKDSLANLYRIADLTQSPRNAALYGQVIGDVANDMMGSAAKRSGGIPSSIDFAKRLVLHSAATNPQVGRYIEYAVENKVAPKIFAPLISATINESLSQKRKPEETPPNPNKAPREDALDGPYQTKLAPQDEKRFQQWVKENNVPMENDGPTSDYDMRGFFEAAMRGDKDASTAVSPFDHRIHFPDKFKTPYHKTFSNESRYARPGAPHWEGDRLIDSKGNVIADETPQPQSRLSPDIEDRRNETELHKRYTVARGRAGEIWDEMKREARGQK